MPRLKIYATKDDLKESNRQKSARYYQKHREAILSRKQQERDEIRRQEDIQFIDKLRKKRMKDWADKQQDLAGPIEEHDPLSRIKLLNHSLRRISGGLPSAWLETIYHQYAQIRNCESTRKSASPVDTAVSTVNNLLKGADVFANRILNSYGVTEYYKRADMFCRRLRWIVRCLEDMEYRVLDPDDDLVKSYVEKRLAFQQLETQAWIDGAKPIPE
ncbi:hypothetical protein VNI00_016543 [Paramarasmius palmivorus]|uniref:Uncharacterized protein n=1 Tax=Paramarasmius palmivorus TaxID=297713 RepID=A0AAW0BDL7_9AGAR